jgi:CRP/FNR family transcriptional regulator, cyclic AMP receptor protein
VSKGRGVDVTGAVSVLARTAMFSVLDETALAEVASVMRERSYRKGQPLFHEGDDGDCLYVLVEGQVKVFVSSQEGEEMGLITLRPPETFGELGALDGGSRSASAVALEATKVLALYRDDLLRLLEEHSSLMHGLLGSMSNLIRRLTEQAADLVFLDLQGRVAKLLVILAGSNAGQEGAVVDLGMTQSELAGMVGASRQAVNQALHSFERRGYLTIRGRKIILARPEALRRRAGL